MNRYYAAKENVDSVSATVVDLIILTVHLVNYLAYVTPAFTFVFLKRTNI